MGEPKERRGDSPDLPSDEVGVPDIQGRGKALLVGGLVLLTVGLCVGYSLASCRAERPTAPSAAATAPPGTPTVEIRFDPATVRLSTTSLELKRLPPPPEQNLSSGAQKP